MRIGQRVKRRPVTFSSSSEDNERWPAKVMEGTVVYIHPKGRFHVVEFQLPGGKVRESFLGVED